MPRLPGESQPPAFDTVEEVKMKPEILMRVCRELLVTPCMDLFASAKHHQFPRYFTVSEGDEEAVGRDAFAYEWSPGVCLYANPPWSLIPNVLWKADHDGSAMLLVTPKWENAPWYPMLMVLAVRQREWVGRIYLSEAGNLRPPPRWTTLFTYLVGRGVQGGA